MIEEKHVDTRAGVRKIAFAIQKRIGQLDWEAALPNLLRTACGLVLAGMLVAGLWPFHSPRNQVVWSAGEGLRFGRHGMILSSGKIQVPNLPANAPCSLEIRFEPERTALSGILFTFYAPAKPRQFTLSQSVTDLLVQTDIRDGRYGSPTHRGIYVSDIFRQGKPLFVTVTSKGGQTSVYIDGLLARTASNFPLSSRDFEGELVVGNTPETGNSWPGLLRGLAFYDQELSPAQVLHHYETWKEKGRPDISENERAVALYRFDEGAGCIIHNLVPSGVNLFIPGRYKVLDQDFLRPFWEEFHTTRSYWEDVLINIVGFAPFGFLCYAYFSLVSRIKRPALITILLGFMLSLTIESLQSFLPTRDSGTTDLITNTSGTYLGVWLYQSDHWRGPLAKVWAYLARAGQK